MDALPSMLIIIIGLFRALLKLREVEIDYMHIAFKEINFVICVAPPGVDECAGSWNVPGSVSTRKSPFYTIR